MRPDLVRLVVDSDRKNNVSNVTGAGTPDNIATIDRVGLSKPFNELPIAKDDE